MVVPENQLGDLVSRKSREFTPDSEIGGFLKALEIEGCNLDIGL